MDTMNLTSRGERWLQYQALWRRTAFFGFTLLTACTGGFLMFDILRANGMGPLEVAGLILFVVLFIWISGAFWTAVAGFIVRLIGHDPAALRPETDALRPLQGRTAVILPIYNEETARVFAGLDAIWSSLAALPQAQCFDFFVLSDTCRPEIAALEEQAWRDMLARRGAGGRLFYRRRSENSGRKAGNIAQFVRNWGGAYDYMLVLDADSVMCGQALVTLAQMMDSHPQVGIIQALTLLAGRETLFARLLQFAVRLNGPMFGGEILSHDIGEAALMRRASYRIWLVPDIAGSWEEVPTNVIDFAARDRRWAQGNLQHLGVMPMRGLHWLSRIHMLTGVLSYVTSPMWLLVLILSSIVTSIEAVTGHQYFQAGAHSLFPSWPQYRNGEIDALLSMTATILFLPKMLGAGLALRNRHLRAGYGGGRQLVKGVLFEQAMSMLLAPTMMLFHTSFVLRALLGRSVGWDAQPRGDRGITWR